VVFPSDSVSGKRHLCLPRGGEIVVRIENGR
jgi:hypothetical protein